MRYLSTEAIPRHRSHCFCITLSQCTHFFLPTVTITSFPCQESLNTVLVFPSLLRLNQAFSVLNCLLASWFHATFALIICMLLQDLGESIHRKYNLLCITFPELVAQCVAGGQNLSNSSQIDEYQSNFSQVLSAK